MMHERGRKEKKDNEEGQKKEEMKGKGRNSRKRKIRQEKKKKKQDEKKNEKKKRLLGFEPETSRLAACSLNNYATEHLMLNPW